jgi:hypothetical protein
MTRPRLALAAAALLALGYLAGRLMTPTRREQVLTTDVREEVRYRSRVEVVTMRATDVQTRTRTQWLPSGEVRQVVELVDRSQDTLVAREDRARDEARSEVRTERVVVEAARPEWSVGALVGGRGATLVAGAQVEHRMGPVWLGAWGVSDKRRDWTAGVSLRMEW